MAMKTPRSTAARLNTGLLVVAALILIGIVGLSYREWRQYQGASAEANRTREVVNSVGRLVSNLIDAETGQRGFLLTGEVRYLEPYNRAIQAVPNQEADLDKLLVQLQMKLEAGRLQNLMGEKLTELRQTIELRKTQGLQPALDLVLGERGKELMDQIRGIAADIQHHAASMRIDAAAGRETAARRAFLITAVGSLILLTFFIVGNKTINKAIHAREVALGEAQNARDSLQTTIASIGDAVIATDAKGRIVFINKVAQSLLRAAETDTVGKHLDDVFRIVNEFSRAKVESPVTRVLREGTIVGLANHTVLIAQDGTEIPIDDSGAPIHGENGSIQGTVLVFRDITARRQAETTGRLLASIVESSGDAIVSRDLNGLVTSWNKGAEQILGYSAGEMIGRPISVIIPLGRADETPAMLERVAKGERIENYETIRRTKSGKLISVAITWSPLYDPLGRIVGFSKVLRDITAQKQAEERFHLAVEAAPNGMLIADEAGNIILVNSQMERLFGYSREELIGQPVEMLVPHQHRDKHLGFRQAFYADARSRLMGAGRDLYGRRKDGSEFPVEIGLNPIDTSDGHWVLGAILDITERKRAEEQRMELAAKERTLAGEKALRERDAELARIARALAVGELAASIAHEVNQPLGGVVTNAEACLRWLGGEMPNVPEAKESLALIVRDGNRASAVIRRIREFLKKERQEAAPVDMNETIREAAALAQTELVKRQIALRLDLFPAVPQVEGDRIQLQQVILNLILNGSEAMASADGPRELLVTSQESVRPGGHPEVLIAVRDSGVGIKPADMKRIFDAFFTTKPSGMGMGLSISRSIIEAHHGRIWAEANDGPGVTVQFSLPTGGTG